MSGSSPLRNQVPVLELRKVLDEEPALLQRDNLLVRHYGGEADIANWLAVRNSAFEQLLQHNRPWAAADFQREFLSRWWWSPQRLWLAEDVSQAEPRAVGVIGWASRGGQDRSSPTVHWLAVAPSARGQGIAGVLLSHLETALWQAGKRELFAQTHVSWQAAVAFYHKHGFRQRA